MCSLLTLSLPVGPTAADQPSPALLEGLPLSSALPRALECCGGLCSATARRLFGNNARPHMPSSDSSTLPASLFSLWKVNLVDKTAFRVVLSPYG